MSSSFTKVNDVSEALEWTDIWPMHDKHRFIRVAWLFIDVDVDGMFMVNDLMIWPVKEGKGNPHPICSSWSWWWRRWWRRCSGSSRPWHKPLWMLDCQRTRYRHTIQCRSISLTSIEVQVHAGGFRFPDLPGRRWNSTIGPNGKLVLATALHAPQFSKPQN